MNSKQIIEQKISEIILSKYKIQDFHPDVQQNKTDFEGDFSVVTFPLVKILKKSPEVIANGLGSELAIQSDFVESYNVVKGFLNISVKNSFFQNELQNIQKNIVTPAEKKGKVMVEYSSPNTNKPLHLGHIRNNLLGFSVSQILEEDGFDVIKTQIINDRGIHICKSMLAWEESGNGETPTSTGIKGDKFVGNYYVEFDKKYKSEIANLVNSGTDEETAKKQAPSILSAQKMLLDWEKENPQVRQLWQTMNSWVYDGFAQTYKRLGVDFDEVKYESNTYLLGKNVVQEGLNNGVFYQKEDGSVWCDLEEFGLGQKLLLRSDGTSVYMTQDLGTAIERATENQLERMIYTVGNEQDYHFQVLFAILKKLGYSWANHLYHLSYGMVELPDGKMKSREGTVVDADDLMQEMYETAKEKSLELGKMDGLSDEEKENSFEKIGMGALKYFMLKVDPKKKMMFNPMESIDFNGNTGPFIQYTFARINSLLKRAEFQPKEISGDFEFNKYEKDLIQILSDYRETVAKASANLSPALVANYLYEVVKTYNTFYQNNQVLNGTSEEVKNMRLQLSYLTSIVIKKSLKLLGIETVERM